MGQAEEGVWRSTVDGDNAQLAVGVALVYPNCQI